MQSEFDWVRHSAFPDPQRKDFRFQSLRAMLASSSNEEVARNPILVGVVDGKQTIVTLENLQVAVCSAERWRVQQGLDVGSRVVLIRLPYSSELVIAVNAIALMAIGVSVVLPTEGVSGNIEDLLVRTECRRVLYPIDKSGMQSNPQVTKGADRLRALACGLKLPECPLPVEFPLTTGRELDQGEEQEEQGEQGGNWEVGEGSNECVLQGKGNSGAEDGASPEVLVLTTSASSGPPKLVRYSELALLRVAESWHAAGLLDLETTGGPSLCPLLSHSMGMRNVLHAVWTRQPTLMIPPEWMHEAPHRALQLLQDWPPNHLTAGPALIDAIAQLSRILPEARKALRSLCVVVSSGSTWTHRNATAFAEARVANAFGMTETQQVLSTLLFTQGQSTVHADATVADGTCKSTLAQQLGLPLPGVSVAVRFDDLASSTGCLFVRSAFKATGYVGQGDFGEWLDTGDVVRVVNDQLEYVGRREIDFLSLGTGLKVATADLRCRYQELEKEFSYVDFRSSPRRMGVAALVYCDSRDPASPELHCRLREQVSALHEQCDLSSDGFHLRHAPLVAVGFVSGHPPHLGIGKTNVSAVEEENSALIEALNDAEGRHPHMTEIEPPRLGDDAWYQSSMPLVGNLMQALKLDVEFNKGRGDRLILIQNGEQRQVLDLVGGYGANLLGHGRTDLKKVAIEALNEIPMLDQGSRRSAASRLATQLSNRVGRETGRRYVCLLSSTGSEAVETALKHALYKWRRRCDEVNAEIKAEFGAKYPQAVAACCDENQRQFHAFQPLLIALQGGFHGKTTGALNAMSDESQRTPFDGLLGARTKFIQRTEFSMAPQVLDQICSREVVSLQRPDAADPENRVDEVLVSGVIAVIAEPIQGEGGILEVPEAFFEAVHDHDLPLIADEIQSGLGRSGRFLATGGVAADYYLIGKSLGGGIAKIAATLVDREVYEDRFDLQTGATFSSDRFACAVASKVLEIIDSEDIPDRARQLGDLLQDRLAVLQQQFPTVVCKVTGRGAMFGIELRFPEDSNRFLKALVGSRLGYVAASYLLNRHGIRILPTLSAPCVLRIEPSVYLTATDVDLMVRGLADFCSRLATDDVAGLIGHWACDRQVPSVSEATSSDTTSPAASLINNQPPLVSRRKARPFTFQHETPVQGARRVGFIFNPIYPADELLVEIPELMKLSIEERMELVWRMQTMMELHPFELFSKNLFNGRVWMCGILLPVTPQVLGQWHRNGNLALVRQRLDEAVMLAARKGCQTVVLGAQTSIVTRNATTVATPPGVQVASGNSFTVATMLSAIEMERQKRGIPKDVTMGIVGAPGNIGSSILRWYAKNDRWKGPLALFGRSGAERRLNTLRDSLADTTTADRIDVSLDPRGLRDCGLIVVAVGGEGIVVEGRHVHPTNNVLIADVSQPRAISPTLESERPQAKVIQAGLVRLKQDRRFRLTPHTPAGTCFACAAEAILMGLEPHAIQLRGEVDAEAIEIMQALGEKYGMIAPMPMKH
ncbi:MAG: aminotransferase class III-fold pyridoxal phosphate-dependent enzyme [Rubripirellula sp.]|nr:aminotransferase class III-fold pyridoxal phosphate-dependent enzyme [Rubripirellula sp.]